MSTFSIFYYTGRSMNDCCDAMDEPPHSQSTPYRSDSAEQKLACRQCQCCIWPIFIPFDLISLPFRGIRHLIKKKKNTNNKNNNSS